MPVERVAGTVARRANTLDVPGLVQAGFLAGRQVQADLAVALGHHPVGAGVDITTSRVARQDRVGRPGVAAAVEWPVFRDRELAQVDVRADPGVLVERGFGRL